MSPPPMLLLPQKATISITSATAGSAVASAKQFDGLIGVVSSTANAASGYLKMIFKVQPQVTAAASIDKGSKHNEYWLYANKYTGVGEGSDTNANLLTRGLELLTICPTPPRPTRPTPPFPLPRNQFCHCENAAISTRRPFRSGSSAARPWPLPPRTTPAIPILGSNTVNKNILV